MKYLFFLIGLIILIFLFINLYFRNEKFENQELKCSPGYKKVESCVKEDMINPPILTIDNIILELSSTNVDNLIQTKNLEELNRLTTHVKKIYEEIKLYQPENNDESDKKTKAIELINNYLEKLLKNTDIKTIEENTIPISENKKQVLELITVLNNTDLEKFKNDIIYSDTNILNKLLNDTNDSLEKITNFSPDDENEKEKKMKALDIINKYKTIIDNEIKVKSNIEINTSILEILYKEVNNGSILNIINNSNLDQLKEFRNKLVNMYEKVQMYIPRNDEEISKKEIINRQINTYLEILNDKIKSKQ
jgi:hypothetical protein